MRSLTITFSLIIISFPLFSKDEVKWSPYQGKKTYQEAKEHCQSMNMRLPTIEELKKAEEAGTTKGWRKNGSRYWSANKNSNNNNSTIMALALASGFEKNIETHKTESQLGVFCANSKTYKNSLGIEFVQIPAGEFQMGCSIGDTECYRDEKPAHTVKITNSFYMGKFEVTQGQWKALMGDNPSKFKDCGSSCPVESVSWMEVQEFIQRLCNIEKYSPCKYRLPTEAEWEYSARAGTMTKYYWGEYINDAYLWYENNSGKTTHLVGKKEPNGFGLYDMTGNVNEWVEDWYEKGYFIDSSGNDPRDPNSGEYRVGRGCSIYRDAKYCRVSHRYDFKPSSSQEIGFRLVLLP